MISKLLGTRFAFSVYSNQRHPIKEIIKSKEVFYDHNINNYDICIQAFLQKRRIQKHEIPPKIYVLDQLPELAETLKQQRLIPMKKSYEVERLQKLHTNQDIDSFFIISVLHETYFKPLMDEYVDKVLVSGRMPPMDKYAEYNAIRKQVIDYFKLFFYGEEPTDFEKEIEFRYLALKQQKFFKYAGTNKMAYKCVWTYSQQRRVELMLNWRARDLNLYDDFRPIYEPLLIEKKLQNNELSMDINQEGIKRRLLFKFFESGYFKKTRKRANWITSYLLTRTMLYCNSMEFNKTLSIPPDFHIENSILNMHIWMIIDKLKKINTVESLFLAKDLEFQFKKYTLERIGKIHLRKKNDFIKDVNHFMVNNRQAFDRHFNKNPKTKVNPIIKLDALVWSTIFFEKISRYSEEVFLMADYFYQNYQYIQSLDLKQFEDCQVNWDVYKIIIGYKERIQQYNPQLSDEEFLEEFQSDKKQKKYYYSYEDEENDLPINKEKKGIADDKLNNVKYGIFSFIRKYQNLDTYDYYNSREEQQKKLKEKKDKYAFQDNNTQKIEVDFEADKIKKIQIERKKQEKQQKSNQ